MTIKDDLEHLMQYEKERDLFSCTYKGVNYWHLIRNEIATQIVFKTTTVEMHKDSVVSPAQRIIRCLPHLLKQTMKLLNPPKADVLTMNMWRPVEEKGKMVDPSLYFVSELGDISIQQYLLFRTANDHLPADAYNNAIPELVYAFAWLYYKLKSKVIKNCNPQVSEIVDDINREFGLKLNANDYSYSVARVVALFKLYKWFYRKLLKGNYKLVYLVCHYDSYRMAMIAAARELGIPTVEQQHGSIGSYNPSYNFLDAQFEKMYLPDYLFTYGDYWNKTCRLPQQCIKISVGSPMIEDSLMKYDLSNQDPKLILFISDSVIGKELSKFAVEFVKLAIPMGYRIYYKFHPTERVSWKQSYPWLAECTEIVSVDQPILVHELLAKAKHVVGVASTVLFEAVRFKCNVYVHDMPQKVYMKDLVDTGCAIEYFSKEDLLKQISTCVDRDNDAWAEGLYCSKSKTAVRHELNKILGGARSSL